MSRAAIRYAKALFEFASEANNTSAVNADMKLVATTIAGNQELKDFLTNPIIKIEVKKSSVEAIFSNIQPETKKLLLLLNENKRFEILHETAAQFNTLFDTTNGIQSAQVTTAVAMSPELENQVLAKIATFSDKKIVVENIVNPEIIGGFILRIGDMQYNASVASKLQELKREFAN